jgi:hypothetical protein
MDIIMLFRIYLEILELFIYMLINLMFGIDLSLKDLKDLANKFVTLF